MKIQWLKDLLQQNAVAQAPAPAQRQSLPQAPQRVRAEQGETLAIQLALVIDLKVCVGCHACVTSCKQWNTSGSAGPLADLNASAANTARELDEERQVMTKCTSSRVLHLVFYDAGRHGAGPDRFIGDCRA